MRFILFYLLLANKLFALATEPANQPTNLTFNNKKAYNFNLTFSTTLADGYLVLKSKQPISFNPIDATIYQVGQGLGNAKVVANGSSNSFLIREVVENTEYHFAVFAFNGSGSSINFKQDNPLTGSVISAVANFGNYYTGLDASSSNFLSQLTQKVRNRAILNYNDYDDFLVGTIFERDTINGQKVINCEYSGETKIYQGLFGFQDLGYSREHLMPRSWMPTGGATTTPEGSDYHNLALTNLNNANSLRSNYPYGEVVNTTTSFLQCKLGDNSQSDIVFEPRESMKGDAARGMFYQMICYNGTGGNWGYFNLASDGPTQDFEVLLNWHFNDLPDAREKAKHEYIASIQNNRNPFIDFPELANCIDFSQITKQGQCVNVPVIEKQLDENLLNIFPNPAIDNLFFELNSNVEVMNKLKIFDITGKEIIFTNIDSKIFSLTTHNLSKGFYYANVYFNTGNFITKKFVVQ